MARTNSATSGRLGDYLSCDEKTISKVLEGQSTVADGMALYRVGEVLLEAEAITREELLEALTLQRMERLRGCILFASLDDDDLRDLSAVFHEVTVPADTQFISQDEHDPTLYILADGVLAVFRTDENGQEIRLASLYPGEPVGEMGYFSDGIRTASVRTVERSELIRVAYDDLTDCFESVPSVASAFIEVITTRQRKTQQILEDRASNKEPAAKSLGHLSAFLDLDRGEKLDQGIGELIRRLVLGASRLTDADRATLFLVDPRSGELWSKVAEGMGSREIRVPAGAGIVGWVVDHGEMLNVIDAYEDERFNREIDKQTGYTTATILCAPVKGAGGRVIGAIQVINKQLGAFNEDDESLLRSFAEQAAVAIRNINLCREVIARQSMMARLLALATSVSACVTLQDLLRRTAPTAAEVLRCERCLIFVRDRQSGELWTEVEREADEPRALRLSRDAGLTGHVFTHKEVVRLADAYEDPRFEPALEQPSGERTRSVMCAPIYTAAGNVVGVLQAANKLSGRFEDEDAELLRAAAAQLGVSALLAR